jgi:hypothetical protein
MYAVDSGLNVFQKYLIGPFLLRFALKGAVTETVSTHFRHLKMGKFTRLLQNSPGREEGAFRVPRGLGHDFAGVVEAVGPGMERLKVGDEVFGVNPIRQAGAFAEYVVADEKTLGPSRPRSRVRVRDPRR